MERQQALLTKRQRAALKFLKGATGQSVASLLRQAAEDLIAKYIDSGLLPESYRSTDLTDQQEQPGQ